MGKKPATPETGKSSKDIHQETTPDRRRLLKVLAAGGGIVAAGQALPGKWQKPVVDVGLLPVHAQTTGCDTRCFLEISLSWAETQDDLLDLLVETPGGTTIDPKAVNASMCLVHRGEQLNSSSDTERVQNITPFIGAGTYRIFVRKRLEIDAADVDIRVRTCGLSTGVNFCLDSAFQSTYDAGTVTINPNSTATANLNSSGNCPQ